MTPREVKELLARSAVDVSKHLLPNGKRHGSEWKCGDVSGMPGKSMGVHLTGNKAGVWSDFATGEGGDLLDLWQVVNGCGLPEAMRQAKEWLGVDNDKPAFSGHKKREYTKPTKIPKEIKVKSPEEMWLEGRRITVETQRAYRLCGSSGYVHFAFYSASDELTMVKWRSIAEKKFGVLEKNMRPILFGWQAIPKNARWVALCEGEIDCCSLYEYGIPALSLPFGGGTGAKHDWIENEYDNLDRFDAIFLVMDQDSTGYASVAEIIDRLGRHRCRVVNLPEKDANDCLMAGIGVKEMKELFDTAETLDPNELQRASKYTDDVIHAFYPASDDEKGFYSPWKKFDSMVFRKGEVTLICGVNGHGKSELTGHLLIDALIQGQKACVASMEFKPGRWLQRIVRQIGGISNPSETYIQTVMNWLGNDRMWVFDVSTTAKHTRMLEVFEYARARYGVTLFVIDNMSKLDIDLDDYNGQRVFIDKLTDFAKNHNVHVFLVAHMRKREDDSKPTGKMDIKGSGTITDLVENVLICWRNRGKEAKLKNPQIDDIERQEWEDKPDEMLICEKQRNGEDEPRIALWFDKESHQYLECSGSKPREYVRMI